MSPTSRRGFAVVIAGLVLLGAPELWAADDEAAGHGLVQTIAKLFNFALLVGILVYFLKDPIVRYLADRTATVRRDLVAAQTLRERAQAQLDAVQTKIAALPAELEALATRGRDELARERDRLAAMTAREREKLLENTRREIELLARVARRDLVEHAADLAMTLAQARIAHEMTPDDQARLVDRYTAEVRS
jgi:F-type H+-transporting ATPase subunit b